MKDWKVFVEIKGGEIKEFLVTAENFEKAKERINQFESQQKDYEIENISYQEAS
jgi:hypothetical protein